MTGSSLSTGPGKGDGREKAEMGQTGFPNHHGPELAPLDLGLSREQPGSCLDQSEYLSVEHFHCTAVWGWLVKT